MAHRLRVPRAALRLSHAPAGFKKSLWFVVAALIGHDLFDLVHPHAIDNGGVPVWWPGFCSAYDVTPHALGFRSTENLLASGIAVRNVHQ